jgi:hypothetical protein
LEEVQQENPSATLEVYIRLNLLTSTRIGNIVVDELEILGEDAEVSRDTASWCS